MALRVVFRVTSILLLILAPGVSRAEAWLVDAMADKAQWALTGQRIHFSLGTSKLDVSKTPARPGAPSVLKLTCDLDQRGWVGVQWRGTPLVGRPERLSVWVCGDGCGQLLAARFEDAAGRAYQVPLRKLDFEGWREVEVPLVPNAWAPVRRLGDLDAPVHWPVSLRELRVVKATTKCLTPTVAFSELRAEGQPRPLDRVEIRLGCTAPANVFYQGAPVQFQAQIKNPNREPVAGQLEAVVCDWLGQEQRHALGELRLAAGASHEGTYQVAVPHLGSYTLWLRWGDRSAAAEGRLRMAVSRRRAATPVDERSPWGMGLYLPRLKDDAQLDLALTLAQEAGVKWTRSDLSVMGCQPEPGQWVWDPVRWQSSGQGHAVDLQPHLSLTVDNSASLNRPCATGELTIALRVRLATLDDGTPWPTLLRKVDGEARQWTVFWSTMRQQLGVSLGDAKGHWTDCLTAYPNWQVGRWYEIVFTHRRADRAVQWWIDGQKAGGGKARLAGTLVANSSPMTIGGGLKSTLDDLAIYDRYLEPSTLASAKPVARWTFDEGRGLQAEDHSGNQNPARAKPWRYDGIFAKTQAQGISTYCILMGTPKWMAASSTEGVERPYLLMPRLDAWSAAVEKLVARQKQAGIRTWEIWNEPNITAFWATEPNPEDYAKLLSASYKAIKRVDPQATVLGCSLAGPNGPLWRKPFEFVEAVLKCGGGQAMDAISIHPYRQPRAPEESGYVEDLQAISDLTAKYGRRLPMWITEVGWPTDPSGSSESRSAQLLVRSHALALAHGVQNIAWYDYRDDGLDPTYNEHHFGILYNDLTPKPSYFAYRTLATELAGLRFEREVVAGDGVSVLVFGNGPRHTAVAWSHRGARQLAFRVGGDRRLEAVDLMGNQRQVTAVDGAWLATIDESATFLRGVPESLAVVRPIETRATVVKVLPGESRTLEVTLRNPFSAPLRLTRGQETIELAAGAERRVQIACSATAKSVGPIEPWRSAGGEVLNVPARVVVLAGQREPILRYDPETRQARELPGSVGANVTDEVTVACRVRSSGPSGTWQSLATKWGERRNWGVFLGRERGDLSFSTSFANGPGEFSDVASGHSLFDDRWHRVAVTYSAHDAEVCFYVDGQLVRRVARDGGPLPANQVPVSVARGFIDGRSKPPKAVAAMSGLRVWNRALSAEEIAAQGDR
jgi:hypothetical protein